MVFVLQSAEAARRNGATVRAVVAASGINSDGRTTGISLPSGYAQGALLEKVYREAEIGLDDLAFMEAHGTGTPVGDPIEASAIGSKLGRGRQAPLPIGSIKTNIGHTEPVSGLAGLMKATLALEHDLVPPSLHAAELNPDIPFDDLNLRVVREALPITRGPRERFAGVNSFGFGGTNAHVVITDAPAWAKAPEAAPKPAAQVLLLSAQSRAALNELALDYAERLEAEPGPGRDRGRRRRAPPRAHAGPPRRSPWTARPTSPPPCGPSARARKRRTPSPARRSTASPRWPSSIPATAASGPAWAARPTRRTRPSAPPSTGSTRLFQVHSDWSLKDGALRRRPGRAPRAHQRLAAADLRHRERFDGGAQGQGAGPLLRPRPQRGRDRGRRGRRNPEPGGCGPGHLLPQPPSGDDARPGHHGGAADAVRGGRGLPQGLPEPRHRRLQQPEGGHGRRAGGRYRGRPQGPVAQAPARAQARPRLRVPRPADGPDREAAAARPRRAEGPGRHHRDGLDRHRQRAGRRPFRRLLLVAQHPRAGALLRGRAGRHPPRRPRLRRGRPARDPDVPCRRRGRAARHRDRHGRRDAPQGLRRRPDRQGGQRRPGSGCAGRRDPAVRRRAEGRRAPADLSVAAPPVPPRRHHRGRRRDEHAPLPPADRIAHRPSTAWSGTASSIRPPCPSWRTTGSTAR